jgi:hypothetical protein
MTKSIEEMRAWLERLKQLRRIDSHYYWSNTDLAIIDSILAALEAKVTEWTPDRPCPKEKAELAGPSEAGGEDEK